MKRLFNMFRESDEKTPKLHPSYRMKLVPTLQMIAQEGKFDDQRISSTRRKSEDEILPVPASNDVFYDPIQKSKRDRPKSCRTDNTKARNSQ